jgi:hypothetical protein
MRNLHTQTSSAAASVFFFALQLPGQAPTTGALAGMVVDSSGAAAPLVRISARENNTGLLRTNVANQYGEYQLQALPVGAYVLTFEKEGFAVTRIRAGVILGQVGWQKVQMAPAGVVEQVDVKERAEFFDPSTATMGVSMGGERVEEAPAQTRNYLNFVLVAPSVAPSAGANTNRSVAASRNVRNDSGFVFPGMRGRNNAILIDGTDNRDETTGENRVAVGLEMIAEFRTTSANLNAEFGGAAGGVVNLVTRTGVNQWHGDATFFTQNEALNARNP